MRSSWLVRRIALVCGVCLVGTLGVLVYYVGFVLKGIYPGQLLILLLLLGTLVIVTLGSMSVSYTHLTLPTILLV